METIDQKISALRALMLNNNLDAYIISGSDPHQSEYVAEHWKAREWISGFTGSAGTVVITQNHAGLWTDSRYFIQAEMELSQSEFVLHKLFNQFSVDHIQWIVENMGRGSRVGVDGWMSSRYQIEQIQKNFKGFCIELSAEYDLISAIWPGRPALPLNKIFDYSIEYSGKSKSDKISIIKDQLRKKNCDYHLISTLDDIAWIFNIRSNDVEYNPVTIAYAVIGMQESILFIERRKITAELIKSFGFDQIKIEPYEDILKFLNTLPEDSSIFVDKHDCNQKLYVAINSGRITNGTTISRTLKAKKNETEINHVKEVMIKDGVALLKMFMWLENQLKNHSVTEADISDQLKAFRSEQKGYFGESFSAIVGYNSNGAIVHYRPERGKSKSVRPEGMLLIDSGGQYIDGTTDITRTIALSTPTYEQIRNFTLVLKGHISLATVKYPEGTIGAQLDILARKPLWDAGLNYLHGTGHGVGFFLNVHEPPQGFTAGLSSRSNTALEPGMITSNEPGFYKENAYGIRIENLILTKQSSFDGYLEHETLSLCPIDLSLVDRKLMSALEIKWLNWYHKTVYQKLSPLLNEKEQFWLSDKCREI